MKPLVMLMTVSALTLAIQGDTRKELAKFEGTWQPVYVEKDGKELKVDIKDDRLVMTGNTFVFTRPKSKMEGKLSIDATKKPCTIDEETTAGDNKGTKTVGIYQIDEKRLMVCYRVAPAERPDSFSTSENSGRFLIIYKRVK